MRLIRSRFATSALAGLLLPAVLPTLALAHEGHGAIATERGLLHWLLEPQHGLAVLGAALLILVAGRAMAPAMRRARSLERRR